MEIYEAWARQNLEVTKENGNNEWEVRCPNPNHPDNDPSANFNVEKGVGHCFSCQHSWGTGNGDINELTMQVKLLQARIDGLLNPVEEVILKSPEATLNRYSNSNGYWSDPIDGNPKGRGLTQEIIDMFGLGYDTMSNAVTIPERRWNGDLIGVTRRFLDDQVEGSRYKYPKGFTAANNLFASWLYEDYDMTTVAITEGAIDTMKIWQVGFPAVALYGSAVSEQKLKILNRIGVERVIYFGDGDGEGKKTKHRAMGWWPLGDGQYKYKPETDMTRDFMFSHVPFHFGYKDAGEMPDEVVRQCLSEAEPYRFRPKKQNYEETSLRRRLNMAQARINAV